LTARQYIKHNFNVPNVLTMMRLLLVPVYIVLFSAGEKYAALTVFFIVLHQVHGRTRQLEFQAESLRMSVSAKEAELAELQQELLRVDSDGHIENVARQEHDFIRKGEILFKFNDPSKLEGYTTEEYQIIMDEMRD